MCKNGQNTAEFHANAVESSVRCASGISVECLMTNAKSTYFDVRYFYYTNRCTMNSCMKIYIRIECLSVCFFNCIRKECKLI